MFRKIKDTATVFGVSILIIIVAALSLSALAVPPALVYYLVTR